jgi:hypothetical protein
MGSREAGDTVTITAQEQVEREEAVRQACHSIEMEGGTVTPETKADLDAYARGEIDEPEMMRRYRARYGIAD